MEILGADSKSRVHFIGIGGISMSSIAMILKKNGYTVTGSDINKSHITDALCDMGIKVYFGHNEENVKGASLVVFTAAIKKDNPEYCYAVENNIKIVERSVFLGELMRAYKSPLCISGTHGKTTTTSMVSLILQEAGLDPTCLIGGVVKELGGNLRMGGKDIFVTESCEYVESFLKFYPHTAVILNVDEDHLDYFRDINHIISAFAKFAALVPENGKVFVNGEDENSLKAVKDAKCEVLTFGTKDIFDAVAKNIAFDDLGKASYDFYYKGEFITKINLAVPGKHNVFNSLAAAASCYSYGASKEAIAKVLKEFKGTERRFEFKGMFEGAYIYDDYAHHPTEIKAALSAAKGCAKGKLRVIFQSHTYTRTHALLKEFSESFDLADEIIVTKIYAAREKDTGLVKPTDLTDLLVKRGKDAKYIATFKEIEDYIRKTAQKDELIITVGAGNVVEVGENLLKKM